MPANRLGLAVARAAHRPAVLFAMSPVVQECGPEQSCGDVVFLGFATTDWSVQRPLAPAHDSPPLHLRVCPLNRGECD